MMVMQYPTRKQNRLSEYDYASVGAYFITVCTYNRQCLFWERPHVVPNSLSEIKLSRFGLIVQNCILEIPNRYPDISVDKFVIMPNHIHLLLQIHGPENGRSMNAPTVSNVIRLMKCAASRDAGISLWQKGFHDHIIRSDSDYLAAWNYLDGNPSKWFEDDLYIPS